MTTRLPMPGVPEFAKIIGASIKALLEKDMSAQTAVSTAQQVASMLIGEAAGVMIATMKTVNIDPASPEIKNVFMTGANDAFDHLLKVMDDGETSSEVAPDAGT